MLNLLTLKDVKKAFSKIKDSDYQEAANAIGVESDEMKNVIKSLSKRSSQKVVTRKKNGVLDG